MVIIWLLLAVGEPVDDVSDPGPPVSSRIAVIPIDNMGEFIGGQVLVLVARPR
jgi:hypothetical protein